MASHIRIVRGTFDPARAEEATSLAQSIDDDLRERLDEYDHLVTAMQANGRFIWLAFFGAQCPIGQEAIVESFQRYQESAKEAAITFNIEEFAAYEVTYSRPSPGPAGVAD